MNMVERVARAIYEKRNGAGCNPWSLRTKAHKAPYLDDARAAIEALRDNVTDEMTDAIEQQLSRWVEDEGVGVDVYLAGINAALNEEKEET